MELIESRVLGGPSAEFSQPAVRMTFRPPVGADPEAAAAELGALVQEVAAASGQGSVDVRSRIRSTGDVVLAFPWSRRGTAQALADAIEHLALGSLPPSAAAVRAAAREVAAADPGAQPDLIDPAVTTVAVTGTNGKTTTTRLLGSMASAAGRRPAWCSTDGVFVAGELVSGGDWSGPGGAREVLGRPEVDFAVLETARGGLMQRGMSVSAVDVAVYTNISTDHLGLQGLDTVADLAWAKAAVCRVVRPTGWVVLNAEDPLVRPWYQVSPGRAWFFALDPNGPGAQYAAERGARITTVVDGQVTVLDAGTATQVVAIAAVPASFRGLSVENIANVLAATSAGLAAGLPLAAVSAGLLQFVPDSRAGAGRMNIWSVPLAPDGGGPGGAATNDRSCTVILDFAHNEAGAVALFRIARGLCPAGGAVHASIGNAGDRTDAGIREVGRIAARAADTVQLAAKSRFLRGRTQPEMDQLQAEGVAEGGGEVIENLPDEPTGLAAMVARARPGDVIAMMVHQDLQACQDLLERLGATQDSPEVIAHKADLAGG